MLAAILGLSGGETIRSFAGVGFQQNEVTTLSASVNGASKSAQTALANFDDARRQLASHREVRTRGRFQQMAFALTTSRV